MFTRALLLTLAGTAAAVGSAPALAGGLAVRFSYNSGGRYQVDCSPWRAVCYEPAPVVCYRECVPVTVYRDCTPGVIVYRDAPRRPYATRTYQHYRRYRTVHRATHRTVRHSCCRSYVPKRHHYRYYDRPHRSRRSRSFGASFHYRGDGGRGIGASFYYRR